MKIEILYPEAGNLFGDSANIKYLRLCLPEAEFIMTGFGDAPAFAESRVDFIYSGPMTEKGQAAAAGHLWPYSERLAELVEGGTHVLFTGNSLELLGNRIEAENDEVIKALGIFDFYSKRTMKKRYNGFFLGNYCDIKITAFNSRFSHSYPSDNVKGFTAVERGIGLNENCPFEGVRVNNCIGTYLLGPLLVLNPLLMKRLLSSLGAENAQPAFFEASMEAYVKRLAEFHDKKRKLE